MSVEGGAYGHGAYGGDPTNNEFFGGQPILPGQGWILDEMYALKTYLSGITVVDGQMSNRPVGVWFNQPDPQIRNQVFPYITLDLIDVAENTAQVQSWYGNDAPDYYPELPAAPAGEGYSTTQPYLTPMLLTFQVSTWARNPRHDVAIMSALFHRQLHPRFGEISVSTDSTNTNGTRRRLVIRGFAKRDTTDDTQKRLYRNIWTVQMTSEIFFSPLDLTPEVQQVIINPTGQTRHAPSTVVQPVSYP